MFELFDSKTMKPINMSKNLFLFFCLGLLSNCFSQSVGFNWAKTYVPQPGGTSQGGRIKQDVNGNIYCSGLFMNTVDFDPGPGTYTLNTLGWSPYLVKLDPQGNFIWARHFRNPFYISNNAYGMDFDLDVNGNIYCLGSFDDYYDFDPGPATYTLNPHNGMLYLCKLNSSGNFVWVGQMGRDSSGAYSNVKVDPNGDVVFLANFKGNNNDFDPGPGVLNMNAVGAEDVVIGKVDPTGLLLWVKSFGGTSTDQGHKIAIDAVGNIVITGSYSLTCDFDPGPGTFTLNSANGTAFVSRLNSLGTFMNTWQVGNTFSRALEVEIDNQSHLILTISFQGVADMDPGPGVVNYTATSGYQSILGKYSTAGTLLWAGHLLPQSGVAYLGDISLDITGNIYYSFQYNGSVDCDFGPGTYFLLTNAVNQGHAGICMVSANGQFIWASAIRGISGRRILGITNTNSGDVYANGDFAATTDFDPGPLTATLGTSYADAFVFKWSPCTQGPTPVITSSPQIVCGASAFTFSAAGSGTISWRSALQSNTYLGYGTVFTSSILAPGTYSFYAAASNTCAEGVPAMTTATVWPLPNLTISVPDTVFCAGESVTLTPGGGINYSLGGSFSTSSFVVTPSVSTTYTLGGSDANGCSSTKTIALSMEYCVGLNPLNSPNIQIKVFPNPCSDKLEIESVEAFDLRVLDVQGKVVMKAVVKAGNNALNVESLKPGVYLVEMKNGGGTHFMRFVKV